MNYLITRDMDSDSDYIKHYGVLGMKWGHKKAVRYSNKSEIAKKSAKEWDEIAEYRQKKGNIKAANRARKNAISDRKASAKYAAKSKEINRKTRSSQENVFSKERQRQKRYLATKRAVRVGQNIANNYLANTNTTLNSNPVRVNSSTVAAINRILDINYAKNSFK